MKSTCFFFFRNSAINQLQILLNVTNNNDKSRISTTYINILLHSLILPTAPTVLAREEHIFIELNEFMLRNCANGQNSQ